MALFQLVSATSGTFNGVTSGSAVNGTAVFLGGQNKRTTGLAANLTVLAETNTFTITAKWQVSADNSTWVDASLANNAANVTLATGTSGTDTAVSRYLPAPDLSAANYARVVLVAGGTTGGSSDTYSISYNFRQD